MIAAVKYWLTSLIPGLPFVAAGFPRAGIVVGVSLVAFWILAWPFAMPLHLVHLLSGVSLLRRFNTWELWEERPTERIWRRQMDGALRREFREHS